MVFTTCVRANIIYKNCDFQGSIGVVSVIFRGVMLAKKSLRGLFAACLLTIGFSGALNGQSLIATITTTQGVVVAELNERAAPTTVANFVNLEQRGF